MKIPLLHEPISHENVHLLRRNKKRKLNHVEVRGRVKSEKKTLITSPFVRRKKEVLGRKALTQADRRRSENAGK